MCARMSMDLVMLRAALRGQIRRIWEDGSKRLRRRKEEVENSRANGTIREKGL